MLSRLVHFTNEVLLNLYSRATMYEKIWGNKKFNIKINFFILNGNSKNFLKVVEKATKNSVTNKSVGGDDPITHQHILYPQSLYLC